MNVMELRICSYRSILQTNMQYNIDKICTYLFILDALRWKFSAMEIYTITLVPLSINLDSSSPFRLFVKTALNSSGKIYKYFTSHHLLPADKKFYQYKPGNSGQINTDIIQYRQSHHFFTRPTHSLKKSLNILIVLISKEASISFYFVLTAWYKLAFH